VKQTKRWFLSVMFVASAMGMGACGRAHLSTQFAQSYSAWFEVQHVKTKAGNAEEARMIIESLDAGEAASVSKSYRKGVARGEDSGGSRMLMIGAQRGGGAGEAAYMPAPSIPQ
jgi:hypothetical protein